MERSIKQVIVVRTDLGMGRGKIASQVAHASLCAFLRSPEEIKERWLNTGSEKIVLKVKTKEELLSIYKSCKQKNLPVCLIKDMARTQLKEPDYTAIGIGPYYEDEIDKITGHLKLL